MELNIFGRLTLWVTSNFNCRNIRLIATADQINSDPFLLKQLQEQGLIGHQIAIYYPSKDVLYKGAWDGEFVVERASVPVKGTRSNGNLIDYNRTYLYVGDPSLIN